MVKPDSNSDSPTKSNSVQLVSAGTEINQAIVSDTVKMIAQCSLRYWSRFK